MGARGLAVPPPGVRRRRGVTLWALFSYVALAVALLLPALVRAQHGVPGSGLPSDQLQVAWFLRWVPYAVGHGIDPLLTDHLRAPDGVNLMWNASMPLVGLLVAPITLTAGPLAAYDAVITASLAVSAWCGFLVCRRFTGRTLPALAGGLLYGFSPYMLSQSMGHANLVVAFTPPLFLLLLHDVAVRRCRSPHRTGAMIGALAAVQLLISEEVLATEALAAGVGLAVLAVLHREMVRERLDDLLHALATAAVVGGALAAGPLLVQFLGPWRPAAVGPTAALAPGTDLLGLVVPTQIQALAPSAAADHALALGVGGNLTESGAYLGLPLLALLGWALWCRRHDALVGWALATAAVLAVLSMGSHLHLAGHDLHLPLPWAVLARVPLLRDAVPERLTVYVYLLVALVGAWLLRDGLARPGRRAMAAAGLGLAVLLSLLPRLPYPVATVSTPAFFTQEVRRVIPEGTIALVLPYPFSTPTHAEARAMLWQAESGMWLAIPGGYAYGLPAGPGEPAALGWAAARLVQGRVIPAGDTLLRRLRAELRAAHVGAVLLGPMLHRGAALALLEELLGPPTARTGGVDAWTSVAA